MNKQYQQVMEFHKKFNHPISEKPHTLTLDRVIRRSKWMNDEVDEFEGAECIEDQADALIDLMYFALGTLVEMGIEPEPLFDIVHEANMTKSLRKDEYGKTIKGPLWKSPNETIRKHLLSLQATI